VYSQTCARCHGSDGRGKTPKGRAVGASDLTSSEWIPDTARDTRIVNRGKEGMPAFKGKLKPAEIDAVVAYIRRFKN
jgi:mono/diheme cytochrome c family protein